jgi:hypothetical protein
LSRTLSHGSSTDSRRFPRIPAQLEALCPNRGHCGGRGISHLEAGLDLKVGGHEVSPCPARHGRRPGSCPNGRPSGLSRTAQEFRPSPALNAGRIFERAESRTDVASACGHLLERGGSGRWPSSFRTAEPFGRRHVVGDKRDRKPRDTTSVAGVMERRRGVRESGPVHVVATGSQPLVPQLNDLAAYVLGHAAQVARPA